MMLRTPIVLAPMAGGPSTPELAAAVSNHGGLGFLAAGYLTPDKLEEHITKTAELTDRPFGVNLFYPSAPNDSDLQREQWREYRNRLVAYAGDAEAFPAEPAYSDDYYSEKLALVEGSPAAYVSFTFGYPSAETIDRLRAKGKKVVLYATTPEEITHIANSGADVLGLQGSAAGGHTASVLSDPSLRRDVFTLVAEATKATDKPIIAGGGVGEKADVDKLLALGATAVQVGTRFLTATEAGTKPTHRRALLEFTDRPTQMTTAFSGKPARAITNRFVEQLSPVAPALYPEVNALTGGWRGRAAKTDDAENLNLWAGTGFAHCREASAAEIMDELAG